MPRTLPAQIVFRQQDVSILGDHVPSWVVAQAVYTSYDGAERRRDFHRRTKMVNEWTGRLLSPTNVIDMQAGHGHTPDVQAVGIIAEIVELDNGEVYGWTQGGPKGSRRYRFASKRTSSCDDPVFEVMDEIIAWAGRRFRVPLVPQEDRPAQRATWRDIPVGELPLRVRGAL